MKLVYIFSIRHDIPKIIFFLDFKNDDNHLDECSEHLFCRFRCLIASIECLEMPTMRKSIISTLCMYYCHASHRLGCGNL